MGSSEGFWQKLEYENIPSYCRHCWHVGHDVSQCRVQHPELRPPAQLPPTIPALPHDPPPIPIPETIPLTTSPSAPSQPTIPSTHAPIQSRVTLTTTPSIPIAHSAIPHSQTSNPPPDAAPPHSHAPDAAPPQSHAQDAAPPQTSSPAVKLHACHHPIQPQPVPADDINVTAPRSAPVTPSLSPTSLTPLPCPSITLAISPPVSTIPAELCDPPTGLDVPDTSAVSSSFHFNHDIPPTGAHNVHAFASSTMPPASHTRTDAIVASNEDHMLTAPPTQSLELVPHLPLPLDPTFPLMALSTCPLPAEGAATPHVVAFSLNQERISQLLSAPPVKQLFLYPTT